MENTSALGTLLAVFIFLSSYKGFRDPEYTNHYIFDIDKILKEKEYHRILSSGFLHGGWFHLIFNLVALLSFSTSIEMIFGKIKYLILFFGSLIGGSLLSLFFHRNHGDYRALGASGAISGIVFASIVLMPDSTLSLIMLPIEFPAWAFGIVFILVSIFGIKNSWGNIGHDAHLGGAIVGMLMTIALYPSVLQEHPWVLAAFLLPCIIFFFMLYRYPEMMMVDNFLGKKYKVLKSKIAESQIEKVVDPEEELNRILEKIRKEGMASLTKQEKRDLKRFSQ